MSERRARGGGVVGRGGGNRCPAFTEAEINNYLTIMGEVVPIGPMEWGIVVERHKELYGAKNRDMTSLRRKFNSIANTTAPTGDPNIPENVSLAKDVMRAIEIKIVSGEISHNDLGIDGEFDEENADVDGNHLLDDLQRNDIIPPPALNNRMYVPQTPPAAPYQAYLAAGSVTRPPFLANRSNRKITADDYYQQMMISRLERQELEEQERERRRLEREERMAELELERRERDRRTEIEKLQKEKEREDERKERAEDRRAQAAMMNMFMIAIMGRSVSANKRNLDKENKEDKEDNIVWVAITYKTYWKEYYNILSSIFYKTMLVHIRITLTSI